MERTAIEAGLAAARMPCRQEVLSAPPSPLVMLDGAHNPQGVEALADTLTKQGVSGLTLVAGMLGDKDAPAARRFSRPSAAGRSAVRRTIPAPFRRNNSPDICGRRRPLSRSW